jgi:hypothetical protein
MFNKLAFSVAGCVALQTYADVSEEPAGLFFRL